MTFLNPFLLFGLAAAAIPIIIHLLNLRKLKTVEFSSLQFLKELQKTKMRRVKVRQILLLILRTLLILLIVLAFARPALRGSMGTIGTHAKSTVVILLDDSPSMSIRDERGVVFNQAIAATSHIVNLVKEGDELHFIRLSEVNHKETFAPSSTAAVKSVIEKLGPSLETAPFRSALGVAGKVLAESKNFNQEVYLITDAQASQFLTAASEDSADLFDDRVKMFVVETGRMQDNLGVTSLDVATQIISKNKPVSMKATLRNFGNTPVRNSLTSVHVDGVRVVQQSIDVAARGSAIAEFTVVPKRRGIIRGYVQLEDDVLEADNRCHFVLNVPENIAILMVGNSARSTRLASLALTLGGDSSMAGLFSVVQTTQSQLSSLDINKFDVLVFCGIREFTATEADRVFQFVNTGGGIMIFPNDESNIANWNSTVFTKLGIPPGSAAQGDSDSTGESSFLSFDKVDYDHPLFQGLFEQSGIGRKNAMESPRVFKAIKPRPAPKGHTIISLSDGSGFLTEYPSGAGRALLLSVEADIGWSDFPLKGVFAPLLHRSMVYLAGSNQNVSSTTVGEPIKATMRPGTTGTSYVVRSPGGIEERVVPGARTGSGMSTFTSSATTEAGVFELRSGTRVLHAAAVNVDPAESDLRHATDEELAAFWKQVGVKGDQARRMPASDKLETAVLESRLGVELWKYLVALAVIVALVEMAVGREPKPSTNSKAA